LVERFVYTEDVGSSSLSSPTIFFWMSCFIDPDAAVRCGVFLVLPRSVGLLTAPKQIDPAAEAAGNQKKCGASGCYWTALSVAETCPVDVVAL
jgi:hypothetical protein